MKNLKNLKHEKEFDTKTLLLDTETTVTESDSQDSKETKEAITLKDLTQSQNKSTEGKETLIYEPRPLTPDDDIYEEIIEQFATAPTKPKYWFEEFGDYWSCSCGHINKGNRCKSCGLERDILRSLFILHKPADAPGKLDKKLKAAKDKVDAEEKVHTYKENKRKQRDAASNGNLEVVPIEDSPNVAVEVNKADDNIDKEPEKPAIKISEPVLLKSTDKKQLPVKIESPSKKPQNANSRIKIIIAIAICLVLLIVAGIALYVHFAAPAIEYDEAKQLQESGKYEEAIAKYETLGNYEDSQDMIRQCYISIGDDYAASGKFKKALETYAIASEMQNSEKLQDKINKAKFGYVKKNLSNKNSKAESYMHELMDIKYPGIKKIYDEYYAWHVNVLANTAEKDFSTDIDFASRKDTVYFHVLLTGGEPDESLQLYYEIIWPNGANQVYDLDSTWKDGSKITAGFQYPIPIFGMEGQLTFKLYDKSTQEVLGSDSITFQK